MAYYAALLSVVQLLKEINHPQHPYPNSLLPKKLQIHESLYERFNLVLELLEDYSPKDESADILEGRIRDAAYHALNIIESQIPKHILQRNRKHLEKVMKEVDLIVEKLRKIKLESHKTCEDDLQQKNSSNGGLVPLLQLLDEISHHDQHPNSLLVKGQIASLHENFKLLQQVVQKEEPAGLLERRIRDAADRTDDIIETHISNKKRGDLSPNIVAKEYGKVSIHGDNMKGTNFSTSSAGAPTQAPRIDGVGEASKVQDSSGRSTAVVLDEDLITTIKSQICGEPSSLAVISLVGMGGLGKTTLARIIFDDKLIHDRFDCRVWVTASQDYHRINILLAIVDSLNMERKEELKTTEVGELMDQIYKHLKGRRFIIVVDDVWETKVWDDLNRIFPNDNNGSRVVTTTRLLNVAVYADNSRFIHELQFLNEDQSWNLFCEKVFCPTELEDIGRLIAKNCQGLPLAIVVVAGLLSKVNTTRCDWEEIARDVSSAAIGQNDEHFTKILSLSYKHLPHHLKPCFLYLGGFPEDYNIRVSELIWLWIAEGLLQPIADKSLEEVGEEYLQNLVQRNLVLIIEKKSCGKIKKCGIHDVLRDLCLQRACFERFFHCQNKVDFDWGLIGDVHRFSLHTLKGSSSYEYKKNCFAHVRSLFFFVEDYVFWNFLTTASDCKLLRALDTRLLRDFVFPGVAGELFHLRYLAISSGPRFQISFSPSILFKLQNLQTLILGDYSLLPSEIWAMPQLRHVKARLLWFPPIPYDEIRIIDGVPLLGNLQTLQTIQDFIFTRDTVEMIPNIKKLKVECRERTWEGSQLNNLVHLRQIEVLSIESYSMLAVGSPLPENFAFPSILIKLTLEYCGLFWGRHMRLVGSLPNLQVLKLRHSAFLGEEWEPAEGEFPKLKFLLMSKLYDLKYWRAEDIHFPCLEKLHIRFCPDLLEIPLGIGDISTLQCIVVEHCTSAVESSALKIQEEQQDLGNYDLRIQCGPTLEIPCEDSNSTTASDDYSDETDDW